MKRITSCCSERFKAVAAWATLSRQTMTARTASMRVFSLIVSSILPFCHKAGGSY